VIIQRQRARVGSLAGEGERHGSESASTFFELQIRVSSQIRVSVRPSLSFRLVLGLGLL